MSAHADPQPYPPWASSILHFPSPVYYQCGDFPAYCLRVLGLFNWPKPPRNAGNSLIPLVSGFPCHGTLALNCCLFVYIYVCMGTHALFFWAALRERTEIEVHCCYLSLTLLQLLNSSPPVDIFEAFCQHKIKDFLSLNFIILISYFFPQNLQWDLLSLVSYNLQAAQHLGVPI